MALLHNLFHRAVRNQRTHEVGHLRGGQVGHSGEGGQSLHHLGGGILHAHFHLVDDGVPQVSVSITLGDFLLGGLTRRGILLVEQVKLMLKEGLIFLMGLCQNAVDVLALGGGLTISHVYHFPFMSGGKPFCFISFPLEHLNYITGGMICQAFFLIFFIFLVGAITRPTTQKCTGQSVLLRG